MRCIASLCFCFWPMVAMVFHSWPGSENDWLPVPPFWSTDSILLRQFYNKTSLYEYTPTYTLWLWMTLLDFDFCYLCVSRKPILWCRFIKHCAQIYIFNSQATLFIYLQNEHFIAWMKQGHCCQGQQLVITFTLLRQVSADHQNDVACQKSIQPNK